MSLEDLELSENHLLTVMGKAFFTERVVYRGRDLHHEVCKDDWFSHYLFGITGRDFSAKEKQLLNFVWSCTSFPDPSIWPNTNSSLGGAARTTASLSLIAGMAISEASIYGRRPEIRSIDLLFRAAHSIEGGESLPAVIENEIEQYQIIYGYGRPLARQDERVPHILQKMIELEFGLDGGHGKYVTLALQIHRYLNDKKGLSINAAALISAVCADMGFDAKEYNLFLFPTFLAGMLPCYIEARDKKEGCFFPIRCTSIRYEGKARRSW